MAKCPYCNVNNFSENNENYDWNFLMHSEELKNEFFHNVSKKNCVQCRKDFYCTETSNEEYGLNNYYCFFLTTEAFKRLEEYNLNNTLLENYLPSDILKSKYKDCKTILSTEISKEGKMALIRPLIEAFVNFNNGVQEENKIRDGIKNSQLDKKIKDALHKIVDDTLKGVHIKQAELDNEPQYVIEVLEALFTKLYIIPEEKRKQLEEFNKKEEEIKKLLDDKINGLKKSYI